MKGTTSSKGSSRSHQGCRSSRSRFSCEGRELSRPSSRRLATKRAGKYRKECEKNPAGERKHGEHSEAGFGLCRSRHREGSMPIQWLPLVSYMDFKWLTGWVYAPS